MKKKKAIILLSGGLDSATTMAIAHSLGFDLYALTIDYGQRHKFEINASRKICEKYLVKDHKVIQINLNNFGGSALTDNIEVPKNRKIEDISSEIPITYVPARNTVLLSIALSWAEILKGYNIFIGVNAVDYSGYPDCRPEFIASFEKLANLATKEGVLGNKFMIHTPLINLSKGDIIRKGTELGVDYKLTSTCYSPDEYGVACGECDACHLRKKGFEEVGINDPINYAK